VEFCLARRMNWDWTLDRYGALIDKELKAFFSKAIKIAKAYHPFIGRVYSDIGEYVLRKGKRLASCSTLLTYKSYTGEVDKRILRVCVGIELYRHCILVHDDLVDRDDVRRGGKAFHRLFSKGFDDRFGEGVAVFVGNMMHTMAMNTLLGSGFDERKIGEIARLLADCYREVNESQILDLVFEYKGPDVDEWRIMASKRAASLFRATILAGAIFGNAPKRDLRILEEAAMHIGYSFDIQDDLIDTFATPEQYGRAPGGDLAHGKRPFHVVYALEMADRKELKKLQAMARSGTLSREDLELAKEVIRGSGALRAAKQESKEHAERAKALIDETSLSDETKRFFESFIGYIEESLDWYK